MVRSIQLEKRCRSMIHIDIKEVVNGFVVEFFDSDGNSSNDYDKFFGTFAEVLDEIKVWYAHSRYEHKKT